LPQNLGKVGAQFFIRKPRPQIFRRIQRGRKARGGIAKARGAVMLGLRGCGKNHEDGDAQNQRKKIFNFHGSGFREKDLAARPNYQLNFSGNKKGRQISLAALSLKPVNKRGWIPRR
jgi:hypothetical protein